MQVKKFEAPSIQEALEVIKRELGPEAIILQTRQNKKGFGLMSKSSVEVTAAVSDDSLKKRKTVLGKLAPSAQKAFESLPSQRQNQLMQRYSKNLGISEKAGSGSGKSSQDWVPPLNAQPAARVQLSTQTARTPAASRAGSAAGPAANPAIATPRVTATRYIDIDAEDRQVAVQTQRAAGDLGKGQVEKARLESEVAELKRMLQDLKGEREQESKREVTAPLPDAQLPPAAQEAYDQLLLAGVEKRHAYSLIKRASFELAGNAAAREALTSEELLDQVAMEVMTSIEVLPPLAGIEKRDQRSQPAVIALVGPTGVGKTTTVAKIAAAAQAKKGWKVGLINLDQFKVAAFDQLATYARLLGVPFRSVSDATDLKTAMSEMDALDLILIDTTGRSQKDPKPLADLKALLSVVTDLRTHLVLSATTRDSELLEMTSRFSVFRPQGLTFSKLDESSHFGAIYNVAYRSKMPLLYFTTGQRVPEDIEEATQERLASLLLGIE